MGKYLLIDRSRGVSLELAIANALNSKFGTKYKCEDIVITVSLPYTLLPYTGIYKIVTTCPDIVFYAKGKQYTLDFVDRI